MHLEFNNALSISIPSDVKRTWTCTHHSVMSRTVREAKQFFTLLSNSNRRQQKALIKTASRQQLLALKEIVVNLLQGNVPLSPNQKDSLKKYKRALRHIANKYLSREKIATYIDVIVKVLIAILPFILTL